MHASLCEKMTRQEAEQILKIQKATPKNIKHYDTVNAVIGEDPDDKYAVHEDELPDSAFGLDDIDLDEVEINLRILLVGAREVGKIMGKKGQTLQNVRTVSGCRIHITNPPEIEDPSKLLKHGKTLKSSCERILTENNKI